MSLRLAFFSALLIASWAVGSASDARTPTSGWVINSNNAKCVAARQYGGAELPAHLILKAATRGGVVQLSVARKGQEIDAGQVKGELAVDERPPSSISVWAYTTEASDLGIHTMYLPAAEFALVREAKIIALRSAGLDESFELSDMAPMMKLLDDCLANLRRAFNMTDPETEKSNLQRRASGNLGGVISHKDYPRDALDRRQGGKLRYVLLIDEAGRVADCSIVETSGFAALDAQACILLKTRARFRNALGSDGKPAKDAVAGNFIWTPR
jgi:TonB family protein